MILDKNTPYKSLPFSDKNLWTALENEHFCDLEVKEHPQSRYLYQYLADEEIQATMILVENRYIDRDYLDDYAAYHVKCHIEYDRHCQRIHFFSLWDGKEPWTERKFESALKEMVRNGKDMDLEKAYLGFVVARPLPIAIIGRTLLKHYLIEKPGRTRKYCKVENGKVNLMGIDLSVESLGFMEQDRTLAACATVALWTCFQKCSDIFKTPIISPTRITALANEAYQTARVVPSDGLTVEQAVCAIHKNCLEAEVFKINEKTYLKSLIYAYLKYNLPVLLVMDQETDEGLHAIAVSGYSLSNVKKTPPEKETSEGVRNKIDFTSSRIDRFFAHDDNAGPYARYDIRALEEPYKPEGKEKEAWDKFQTERKRHGKAPFAIWRTPPHHNGIEPLRGPLNEELENAVRFVPTSAIVPLYHKIRVDILDIQEWINKLSILLVDPNFLERTHMAWENPDMLEWDIYLTDQRAWKMELGERLKDDLNKVEMMRKKANPKYIWRSTLKYGNAYMVDLLADATDIGGRACPFYEAVFYDERMEQVLAQCYSKEEYENGTRWTNRQLDGFFYKYFQKNLFS